MNKRLELLSHRKRDLMAQCAKERLELAQAFSSLRSSITFGAALLGLGRILKSHPMVTAAVSSLLASGYAGKITKSGGDLLKLLGVARPLWSWWSKRRRPEVKTRATS
jgi:hypothetical protein